MRTIAAKFTSAAILALGAIGTGAENLDATVSSAHAQTASSDAGIRCSQLAGRQLGNAVILTAAVQPSGAEIPDARRPDMTGEPRGAPVKGLQAFCRVSGTIRPEARSDVRFEVWMPMSGWNGRLFGANNGGFAGSMRYDDLAAAVANGGAGAATDSGHTLAQGPDWARGRPDLIRDYGWRALHVTTVAAKEILRSFYGRGPANSFFVGCSNGGRMALMAASRFPEDYDGIVAGAPVISWTGTAMSMINVTRAQAAPGAAIRPEQAQFVQSEVLRQCDAIDGQRDGLVVDPLQCRFDYSRLACGTSSSKLCFSPPQIDALKAISLGPRDSAGKRVDWGYPLTGAEVGVDNVGWEATLLSPRGTMAEPLLRNFVPNPFATPETFDFDVHPPMLRAMPGGELDPQPDLTRFFARGGKLILWHGWADSVLSPTATLDFYKRVSGKSGSAAATSMRLFMIPGVDHCSGGPGADAFGQIGAAPREATSDRNVAAAAVDWVEKGRVPSALMGRHGNAALAQGRQPDGPPMERLHCAYPARPVLRPGGDPDKAASYTCRR